MPHSSPARRADPWATTLLGLLCACTVLAWARADGGVGPDGAAYLRAAWWFTHEGHRVLPAATPSGEALFATWPPGYPALLALPTALGVPLWWSARLVAALSLGTAAACLRALLGPQAFNPLPLALGSTWFVWMGAASEGPFVAALLLLALALVRHHHTQAPRWALLAGVAATLAFSLRYLGVAGIAVLVLVAGAHALRSRWSQALSLAGAALMPCAAAAALLGANLAGSGQLTGTPRPPAPEPVVAWMGMAARGLATELVLPVPMLSAASPWWMAASVALGLQVVVLAWWARANRPWRRPPLPPPASWIPLLTGGVYLAALLTLRWRWQFDTLGWRLLAPASTLTVAGLWAWRPATVPRHLVGWVLTACTLACTTLVVALDGGSMPQTRDATLSRYAPVPTGCVVGPHDPAMPWVRPDLIPAMPTAPPYDTTAETVQQFIHRISQTPHPCVWLEVRDDLRADRYHPSWAALAGEHPDRAFVVIR